LSNACRAEFETDDDLLDAPRDATFSLCASNAVDTAGFTPPLNFHFLENEGNLVPNRVARAVKFVPCLLFLNLGLIEANSPSLKNPSAKS
jgi:hypothetical protein